MSLDLATTDVTAALREHARERTIHVERLRSLVRSLPADRLPGLTSGAAQWAKLRRNAYAALDSRELSWQDSLILMACAVHDAAPAPPVFSNGTADAIWGLPTIGQQPTMVEYVVPPGTRGHTPNVRRRRTDHAVLGAVEIGGLWVTPYERTVVDHARGPRLESSIAVCDNALHVDHTDRDLLLAELDRVPKGRRGRRMAQLAIHLADGRAESPLESLSRTRMFQYGLPMPVLQHSFFDADGHVGRTDFYWPEVGLVGESDGGLKYAVSADGSSRDAVEVLQREKKRERRLRTLPEVDDVVRWDWNDALPPGALHAILAASGLRTVLDGGWPVPDGPLPTRAFPPWPRGSDR